MKTPTFPMKVKKGSSTVTIYSRDNKGYPEYTLAFYQEGKRTLETSADFLALRARADEVLDDLKEGRTGPAALKLSDRNDYARAVAALRPTGQALDVAVKHYAKAVEILGADLVVMAAQEYAKRHLNTKTLLVSDAVKEFIAEKERQKRTDTHVQRLTSRLTRFAESINQDVASVTAADIDLFLDGLKSGLCPVVARTRDNWAGDISNFFNWTKRKRYVPSDYDEHQRVTRMHSNQDGLIEIYTPEEMIDLLKKADTRLIPFLVIGAFAGLRSSEFLLLDWSDVKFENGSSCIVVQKGKVKQRGKSRRIVPMTKNLKAWLSRQPKKSGPIWPHSEPLLYKLMAKLPGTKNNALRHSFISYRVASTKNVNQVALEAGNSSQIIFSNYRELVTEQDGQRWFEIKPKAPKKPKQP